MKGIAKIKPAPGVDVSVFPEPEVKPGWALIRVRACGICGSDIGLYEWRTSYQRYEKYLPLILGHEFSGEIVQVGDGVRDLEEGDRVVCMPLPFGTCGSCYYCRTGQARFCASMGIIGIHLNGAMSEYALVPAEHLFKIPDNLSYEAAAVCEPLAVAYYAVSFLSHIRCGQTAAVIGPGPIGLLTVLSLRIFQPESIIVFGTVADKMRLKLAEKLGADLIVNLDEEDPIRIVKEKTRGFGVDVVFNATYAPQTVQLGLNLVKKTGELIMVGIPTEACQVDVADLVRTEKRIQGSFAYSTEAWVYLMKVLEQGVINPEQVVSHKLPLTDAIKGFELARKKEGMKVLFIP